MDAKKVQKLSQQIESLKKVRFKMANWSCLRLETGTKHVAFGDVIPAPGITNPSEDGIDGRCGEELIKDLNDAIKPVIQERIDQLEKMIAEEIN